MRKYRKKEKECGLTSSETRGMDFLRGRHSRSVLMSLKKGFAPGGPDCVAPVFSWIRIRSFTIMYSNGWFSESN